MPEYPDPLKNACPTYRQMVPEYADPFVGLFSSTGYAVPPTAVRNLQVQLLHPDAKLPTRGSEHAAGLDLTATSVSTLPGGLLEYGTGIAVHVPSGYVGLIFPRSSISNTALRLSNSTGVLDPDFRGEIKLRFDNLEVPESKPPYEIGERIGQLVIVPCPVFEPVQVSELTDTRRGSGGFGSTGNK